jgi:uncharacterized membrane protein YhaH (DUF805 family)
MNMVGVISCPSCNSNVSIGNTSCWKCGHEFATSDRQIAYQKANGVESIFGFNGRLNRKGFILREAISLSFLFVSFIIAIIAAEEFIWLGLSVHALITVSASVRRLHDCDQSGWIALFYLTGIGWLLVFWCAIRAGDGMPNKYGHNPTGLDVAL